VSEVSRLVLDSVQQDVWWPHAPGFMHSRAEWKRAIDYSVSLHAELPFAVQVRRASWAAQVPAAIAGELEAIERRDRMRLALLDLELDAALEALLGAGIPVLVLKGADVARRFYPERILRPMGDIDLLVPQADYQRAWSVLGQAGFAATEKRYAHCFRSALARSAGGPSIDLHFGLIEGDSPGRLAALWRRSVRDALPGLPSVVRALSAEDCLVYTLRHCAVLHVLEGPVWLADLHWIIVRNPVLDWRFVMAELEATRSRAAAWFVFRILRADWGTPVPREVLEMLGQNAGLLRRAAALLRRRGASWFPVNGRGPFWMMGSRYLLRENAWEALRYAHARWRRKRRELDADRLSNPGPL
jgi:hypothetical protein